MKGGQKGSNEEEGVRQGLLNGCVLFLLFFFNETLFKVEMSKVSQNLN